MRVMVVGAGVIGLSCAIRLAEAGHEVAVLARDLPLETTSAVAAAWWYPHRAGPQEKVNAWGVRTYDELERLAESIPDAGVRMRESVELLPGPSDTPWWGSGVRNLRRRADRIEFTSPVAEMPIYLPYLTHRLAQAGAAMTRMALSALPLGADVVVNCAGLANRGLTGDDSMVPVRGQVVLVEQVGVDRVWLDSRGPDITYVVPRSASIVVGGTDEEGSWDLRPDPGTAEAILQRATRLVPELSRARVLAHRVGLRPVRPMVRLEAEQRAQGSPVVHCYGHGGAGVTLSWGCADEVMALVASLR